METFFFTEYIFWSTFASTISSLVTSESSIILAKYLPFLQLHIAGSQIQSFLHIWCFLHLHLHLSLLHLWSELNIPPSNLHLHLNETSFINVFYSFIPVIILNTVIFKSSVLFRTYNLLDKLSRVLQLAIHSTFI